MENIPDRKHKFHCILNKLFTPVYLGYFRDFYWSAATPSRQCNLAAHDPEKVFQSFPGLSCVSTNDSAEKAGRRLRKGEVSMEKPSHSALIANKLLQQCT